jgi:diacylglycerol kinase family enzyme
LLQTPYAVFDIVADGQHIRSRGIGVVVANAGNLLGPYFTLTPGATPDDGLLDICILASRHRGDYATTLVQILSRQQRAPGSAGVQHVRAKHITIRSRPSMKVQADGDIIGVTPMVIEALPNAVEVFVPSTDTTPHLLRDSIVYVTDHIRWVLHDILTWRP